MVYVYLLAMPVMRLQHSSCLGLHGQQSECCHHNAGMAFHVVPQYPQQHSTIYTFSLLYHRICCVLPSHTHTHTHTHTQIHTLNMLWWWQAAGFSRGKVFHHMQSYDAVKVVWSSLCHRFASEGRLCLCQTLLLCFTSQQPWATPLLSHKAQSPPRCVSFLCR